MSLAELFLADSRKLSLDLENYVVITDPVWPNVPDHMFNLKCSPARLLREVLNKYASAARAVIIMRCDSDPRFLTAVPKEWKFFRACNLQYALPAKIGRKLVGHEVAYCFGKPIPVKPGQRLIPGECRKTQPGRTQKGHPCARNLDHMRWLVNWFSQPGEIIVDPFMGTGTTGVAAVERGRRFVGIEIDPDYFEIASREITRAEQQLKLPFLGQVEDPKMVSKADDKNYNAIARGLLL